MMPLYNVKSIRQELIKLRGHNPEVEEIPIDEDGCLENIPLMNMLMERLEVDHLQEGDEDEEKDEKKTDFMLQDLAITAAEVKSDLPNSKKRRQ